MLPGVYLKRLSIVLSSEDFGHTPKTVTVSVGNMPTDFSEIISHSIQRYTLLQRDTIIV